MSVPARFFQYTEIKTKITSVCTFILVLSWLFAQNLPISVLPTAVFFGGMFLFDLTVTSINNYMDSKKNGQPLPFPRPTAKAITFILFGAALGLSLWLVALTDLFVLALGAVCFLFGLMYSAGPVPISHGPYGELVSGLFYGAFIPAILVYINAANSWLFGWAFTDTGRLDMSLAIGPFIGLVLLCVTPVCLTANIMLANNICDEAQDILVGRYTLPHYLGRKWALRLFVLLYCAPFAAIIAMVVLRFIPPLALVSLLAAIPVLRNAHKFSKAPDKATTFPLSIQNFLLTILPLAALIFLGALPSILSQSG